MESRTLTLLYNDVNASNSRHALQIENKDRGLKYAILNINSLNILTFADASFANNPDLTS